MRTLSTPSETIRPPSRWPSGDHSRLTTRSRFWIKYASRSKTWGYYTSRMTAGVTALCWGHCPMKSPKPHCGVAISFVLDFATTLAIAAPHGSVDKKLMPTSDSGGAYLRSAPQTFACTRGNLFCERRRAAPIEIHITRLDRDRPGRCLLAKRDGDVRGRGLFAALARLA